MTAESYLAVAKLCRSGGLHEQPTESSRAVAGHYLTAARQYEQLIVERNLRVAGRFLLYAVATGAFAVLDQKQAQMQVYRMAEISAPGSPTGVGVGYGYASYPVAVSPGFESSCREILDARLNYCKKLAGECSATAESL